MATVYDTVVVPGFGGSQLSYLGGSGGKTVAWYNPDILLSLTPLVLALDSDGNSPYPKFGRKLFPDGPVAMGIYEPLLTSLVNAGRTPLFFPWDWRKDFNNAAAVLVKFLQGQRLHDPFSVVAHSAGGLVAQLAYPLWTAGPIGPTWKQTIYMDVPHGGSHWASLCLDGVYSEGNWLNILKPLFQLSTKNISVSSFVYSAIAKTIATAVGSWPGIYQLLPNPGGQWAALDPLATQGLLVSNYANGPGGVQNVWMQLAITTQGTLLLNRTKPLPLEAQMMGGDQTTPYRFVLVPFNAALNDCLSDTNGDGTVNQARGTLAGVHLATFSRTKHNGICNTEPPLDLLNSWLTTPPTTDTQQSNDVVPNNALPIFTTPGPPSHDTWASQFANKHQDP